jgi:hypothetical protein
MEMSLLAHGPVVTLPSRIGTAAFNVLAPLIGVAVASVTFISAMRWFTVSALIGVAISVLLLWLLIVAEKRKHSGRGRARTRR